MKLLSIPKHSGAGALPAYASRLKRAVSRQQQRLPGMTVKTSLRAAFAVVLLGTFAIGAIALRQIGHLDGAMQSIYTQGHIASRAAEETRSEVLTASRSQKMLVTASTAAERDTLGLGIEKSIGEIAARQDVLKRYTDAADKGAVTQQQQLAVAVRDWTGHLRTFVALVKTQSLDLSQMNWQVGMQDVSLMVETAKVEKLVDALVTRRASAAKATIDTATGVYHASFVMLLVLTLGLIGVAVVVSEWVVRRIAVQLGGEPGYAKEISRRIAAGDLSQPVALVRDDQASMLHALAKMQTDLAATIGDISVSSAAIAAAAGEISMGNVDLANRTEQQAMALEKTASNMDELTATVQQNAANAKRASALAHETSRIAEDGGAAVARLVATMRQINDSAHSISDITGVIESIAFQTNILALNAAVEAARAGPEGRGFAVVAGEVRNLAQRSAAAAKEIKTLIQTSQSRVTDGAAYAQQAGGTMDDVLKAVRRVSDIIVEIAAASTQQSAGIADINGAVSEMDAGTQQNAALVEEAAAAARALDDQARSLKRLVGKFQLV
ncbi:MAG: methyl-accepting chemotaxis protein [Janthinobacterium lividum]